MTTHKNIYEALAAAQGEFGKVTKGATNPAFKSRYADLADVAGVVIPTMNAHGCCVLHYVVDGAMRTEFVHAATETKVFCDVPLIVDKQNMQGMKSATTYAKRIGLESLSGIAPEDDDGNAASKAPPRQQQNVSASPPALSDDDFAKITMLIKATSTQVDAVCKAAKVDSLDKLTPPQAAKVIEKLETKLADMAKAKSDAAQPADDLDADQIQY